MPSNQEHLLPCLSFPKQLAAPMPLTVHSKQPLIRNLASAPLLTTDLKTEKPSLAWALQAGLAPLNDTTTHPVLASASKNGCLVLSTLRPRATGEQEGRLLMAEKSESLMNVKEKLKQREKPRSMHFSVPKHCFHFHGNGAAAAL